VHGGGVDERDELHVQCDCDECFGCWCGFVGLGCCGSFDGAGCSDRGERDWCCERPVCCVVDCAIQWWRCDQFVHGDVDTGFVHLHDGNNHLHGGGVDERDELHVHGDRDECFGYWCGVDCEFACGSIDGAGCSDRSERDWCCERIIGCVVVCTCEQWWFGDLQLHGDVDAGFVHVHDSDYVVHGDRVDERDLVHVHGDGDECQWDRCGFGGVGGRDTVDGAWCSDFGVGNLECERFVGCVVDCAGQ